MILSTMSELTDVRDGEYNWKCEFCGQTNKEIHVELGEIPRDGVVDCIFFWGFFIWHWTLIGQISLFLLLRTSTPLTKR